MADLENLLLEAAGRTGSSSRKNLSHLQARQRHGGYSDDDSNDSDTGSDEGPSSRKRPGSQIPLKKRFDAPEKDGRGIRGDDDDHGDDDDYDDDDSNDSDSDASSYRSDLYKDDEDKEKLSKMTELERESILADRATKRGDYNLKKKVKAAALLKSDRKDTKEARLEPSRFSRSAKKSDRLAKDDALNELRAKRLKQQDPVRRTRDAIGGRSLRDSSPAKERRSGPTSPGASNSDEDESGKRHGTTRSEDLPESESDMSEGDSLTFDDIKAITIRRSKLGKWFMEPFFEELIAGCFVRLGIGVTKTGQRIYRLCMVKNVDATDPDSQYQMENKTTHKYLNCVWGNDASAARWQMARVSDAPPLEEEFKALMREVERGGGEMPVREDVFEKVEAIRKINTFVYSPATVKQMLQEKKSATRKPLNVAAEKDRLRKQMEKAESRDDEAEMARIKARLKELEVMSNQLKGKDSKAVRLSEMNKKNRAENFRRASEIKPVNTSLKAGEAGYDPFSRRWTRSRNYYASKPGGDDQGAVAEGEAAISANGLVKDVVAGAVATAAALEAAADAGKLVDTRAPVDLGIESNTLHNFELPISLAGFGGAQGVFAGFMARKQKIEATIGYRVAENDGRRHALTLTVGDYKRRRGLL